MLLTLALAMSDPDNSAFFYLESDTQAVCVISDAENPGLVEFRFVENAAECPDNTVTVVKMENIS